MFTPPPFIRQGLDKPMSFIYSGLTMPDESLSDLQRSADVARALQAFENQGKPAIKKVRYTHDAMIDLIIQDPWVSQNQLAEVFGFTASWVSIVINSDAFQARLAARKEVLVDPTIRLSLEERFRAVVTRSMEVLQDKLSKPSNEVPDNLALRAMEIGAKALGIGGHAAPPPPHVDHLAGLADRLLALQGRARGTLTYDEGSATFGLANAQEPHASRPSERFSVSDAEVSDAVVSDPSAEAVGHGFEPCREVAPSELGAAP